MPFYVSDFLHTPGARIMSICAPLATLNDALIQRGNAAVYEVRASADQPANGYAFEVVTMAAPPPLGAPPLFVGRGPMLVIQNTADPFGFWTGAAWGAFRDATMFRPEHRPAIVPPHGGGVVEIGALPRWLSEFPEIEARAMPAVPAVFADESYGNDVCPSFYWSEYALSLWTDYADPDRRDDWADAKPARFRLYDQPRDADGAPTADEWPVILETEDWNAMLAAIIGEAFAGNLRRDLSPSEWAEMRRRNVLADAGVCASHDFCDANMPMLEAFEAVTGHGIGDPGREDGKPEHEEDCALWSAAWAHAQARHLTDADAFAHTPESCPTKHYNDGTDICADCGAHLQ